MTLEGAIAAIAPWPGHALTTLDNGLHAVYCGGPTIGMSRTDGTSLLGEAMASYADVPGNLPAVILWNGLLLTSVHLEAFEGIGLTELSTADRLANHHSLADLVDRAAGTSFTIRSGGPNGDPNPTPTPSPTALFSDGFEGGLGDSLERRNVNAH